MTQSSTHTIQPLPAEHNRLESLGLNPNQNQHLASTAQSMHLQSTRGGGESEVGTITAQLLLFNRERPLLEKIKSMRLEQVHMENRVQYLTDENEQLRRQLKLYQSDELSGDSRLKKHIQLLQDEVNYLTQINEKQDQELKTMSSQNSKRKLKRDGSKSGTRMTRRKSQLRADIERSRSGMHRDCCIKKKQAIEEENYE